MLKKTVVSSGTEHNCPVFFWLYASVLQVSGGEDGLFLRNVNDYTQTQHYVQHILGLIYFVGIKKYMLLGITLSFHLGVSLQENLYNYRPMLGIWICKPFLYNSPVGKTVVWVIVVLPDLTCKRAGQFWFMQKWEVVNVCYSFSRSPLFSLSLFHLTMRWLSKSPRISWTFGWLKFCVCQKSNVSPGDLWT